MKVLGLLKALSLLVFLSSCASMDPDRIEHGVVVSQAGPAEYGKSHEQLISLPEPKGKITVAVYDFSDYTGQNKPAPSSGFSKMVTQGGRFIVVKALLDSGWFKPVVRSSLNNLLTERKIWEQNIAGQNAKLPALPHANVIIEGGIVGYDSNIRTGGAGAKYLGIGGSTKYREDSVVVNLSLINPLDGTVLHSINSSKTIYSNAVDASLFGYVTHNQILEIEAGYAQNEPVQASVVETIESALINLIAEGLTKKTWLLKNPEEISSPAFTRFLSVSDREKYIAAFAPSLAVPSAAGSSVSAAASKSVEKVPPSAAQQSSAIAVGP